MNWCILIPLLVGLISAILGYLLGRLFGGDSNNTDELNSWKNKHASLERNLDSWQSKYVSLQEELNICKEQNNAPNTDELNSWKNKYESLEGNLDSWKSKYASLRLELDICREQNNAPNSSMSMASGAISTFDRDAAKLVYGKSIKENDLKIVEGIGPKIEQLFNNDGINTWAQLAETSYDRLKKILDDAGDAFKMHNPTTWPDQAAFARDGKWAELKKWQDELDGGK